MKIIRSLSHWPEEAHGSVMALGNFDGMHRGHQIVIAQARVIAAQERRPLAIMTFEPHPRRFFKPELPVLRIAPFADKARLLREAGVKYLYVPHFNRAFSELSADAFIRDVLLEKLKVAHVVTGHNFAFGYQRAGDVSYLQAQAQQKGFGYTQVEAAIADAGEHAYSSTSIRQALERGDVGEAAHLLGRPYTMHGPVIHGDARGRSIGFPTANIRPAPLFMPCYGVYAVRLHIDGAAYPAVANLGLRPTVDGNRRLLEVHALDMQQDFYGKQARVEFLQFIRPEQKFADTEALKAQIAQDAMVARDIHSAYDQKVHA